jgi:hypothetical protein
MTDDELKGLLEAMEGRLMSRITNAQEVLIERVRTVEAGLNGVAASVAALTEVAHSTNTLIGTLAGLMTDVGRRVTDLEKK